MAADHFRDLAADGHDGVERGQRVLKDDRYLTAANGVELPAAQLQQVAAREDGAPRPRMRSFRQQSQE